MDTAFAEGVSIITGPPRQYECALSPPWDAGDNAPPTWVDHPPPWAPPTPSGTPLSIRHPHPDHRRGSWSTTPDMCWGCYTGPYGHSEQ